MPAWRDAPPLRQIAPFPSREEILILQDADSKKDARATATRSTMCEVKLTLDVGNNVGAVSRKHFS
jgi:hypothetical protein